MTAATAVANEMACPARYASGCVTVIFSICLAWLSWPATEHLKLEEALMPWQGKHDNMIDRFDVRSMMDIIDELPEGRKKGR